jgi:hypothetical protein
MVLRPVFLMSPSSAYLPGKQFAKALRAAKLGKGMKENSRTE